MSTPPPPPQSSEQQNHSNVQPPSSSSSSPAKIETTTSAAPGCKCHCKCRCSAKNSNDNTTTISSPSTQLERGQTLLTSYYFAKFNPDESIESNRQHEKPSTYHRSRRIAAAKKQLGRLRKRDRLMRIRRNRLKFLENRRRQQLAEINTNLTKKLVYIFQYFVREQRVERQWLTDNGAAAIENPLVIRVFNSIKTFQFYVDLICSRLTVVMKRTNAGKTIDEPSGRNKFGRSNEDEGIAAMLTVPNDSSAAGGCAGGATPRSKRSLTALRSHDNTRQMLMLELQDDVNEKDFGIQKKSHASHKYINPFTRFAFAVFAQNYMEKVEDVFIGGNKPEKMEEFLEILKGFDPTTEKAPKLYYVSFFFCPNEIYEPSFLW